MSKQVITTQSYGIKKDNFNQNNTRDIKPEKNGKSSSVQAIRHINIQYFFMKDRFREDGINIIYCPTEIMVADYFTKSLKGSLCIKLRNVVMGYSHPSTFSVELFVSDEERVEITTVGTSIK